MVSILKTLVYMLLALFLQTAFCKAAETSRDSKFDCSFTFGNALHNTACKIALFHSRRSFRFDRHKIYVTSNDLCSLEDYMRATPSEVLRYAGEYLVAARRGKCSFLEKNNVTTAAGHAGLIVINNDADVFPFGEQEDMSSTLAPAVMVEASFGETALSHCANHEICIVYRSILSYVSLTSQEAVISSMEKYLRPMFFTVIILSIGMIVNPTVILTVGAIDSIFPFILIVSLSLLMKLGTFRRLDNSIALSGITHISSNGNVMFYNHKEMDEKIFEYLVDAMSHDWSSYYIPTSLIEQYRLSPENYGDNLFIHPPLYVLLCLAGKRWMNLSLPAMSLLLHALTCALIPALVSVVLRFFFPNRKDTSNFQQQVSLWAVVIYAFCPVVSFVSQKVWIDNAAVLCVTFSAALHLYLASSCRDAIYEDSYYQSSSKADPKNRVQSKTVYLSIRASCFLMQYVSGLVFGGIALNSKISCLALLPFMIAVSILTLFQATERCSINLRYIYTALFYIAAFVIGMMSGHGPWLFIYWRATGRLLPNAWPSATMLANSEFVKSAVGKGTWTYFRILFEFSPAHMVGLSASVLCILQYISKTVWTSRGAVRNSWLYLAVVMLSWPVCFIVGFTILGMAGAGFQSRFILPALPATAVLTAMFVISPKGDLLLHDVNPRNANDDNIVTFGSPPASIVVLSMLVGIGVCHTFYYCVLYPTLFADFEFSMVDVLSFILNNPLKPLESKSALKEMLNFMVHHGLNISTSS